MTIRDRSRPRARQIIPPTRFRRESVDQYLRDDTESGDGDP
jgi:hypothetical protein